MRGSPQENTTKPFLLYNHHRCHHNHHQHHQQQQPHQKEKDDQIRVADLATKSTVASFSGTDRILVDREMAWLAVGGKLKSLNKDIITSLNIFCLGGSSNTDSGKVDGSLETKYKFAEYGTTFTEKWNTNNQLSTTIDVQDKILKGLKLTFDSEFSPQVIFIFTFMSSTCRPSNSYPPIFTFIKHVVFRLEQKVEK